MLHTIQMVLTVWPLMALHLAMILAPAAMDRMIMVQDTHRTITEAAMAMDMMFPLTTETVMAADGMTAATIQPAAMMTPIKAAIKEGHFL